MTRSVYPLAWPLSMPRTEVGRRAAAPFKTGLPAALKNVESSLNLFGRDSGKKVDTIVISTNYALGDQNPRDPGVAVWFVWDGRERCIAVDRYPKIEHNLQAIHHILEARRTEMRHGGLHIVRQTFTGFIALPAPTDAQGRSCWEILGVQPAAPKATIEEAYKEKARKLHPDAGGDGAGMSTLNAARDAALAQVIE